MMTRKKIRSMEQKPILKIMAIATSMLICIRLRLESLMTDGEVDTDWNNGSDFCRDVVAGDKSLVMKGVVMVTLMLVFKKADGEYTGCRD